MVAADGKGTSRREASANSTASLFKKRLFSRITFTKVVSPALSLGTPRRVVGTLVLTQLETELRQIARLRIAAGQLPHSFPLRMWGGYGTGRSCSLCEKPIAEAEIEVEQVLDGKLQTFQFHVLCQSLWQLECVREYHRKQGLDYTASGLSGQSGHAVSPAPSAEPPRVPESS